MLCTLSVHRVYVFFNITTTSRRYDPPKHKSVVLRNVKFLCLLWGK
jgi:hypothetical protein